MYSKVFASNDESVMGAYVQVQGIYGHSVDGENSIRQIKFNEPVDFNLKLPSLLLDERAKFTDILSHHFFGVYGLTVSDKVRHVLSSFELDAHQWFECEVRCNTEFKRYWFYHVPYHRNEEIVDWSRSRFVKWQSMGHISAGEVKVNSFHEYLELKRELKGNYSIKPIYLEMVKDISYDAFWLVIPFLGHFISDRLKEEMILNELTGFEYVTLSDYNKKLSEVPGPWRDYAEH